MCTGVFLLTFAIPAFAGDPKPKPVTLRWTGCGITRKAFMGEAAKAYQKKTGIRIRLSGGGATKGIRFAAKGASELGGTCRACLPKLSSVEGQAQLTVVAWDALVPVVHKSNKLDSLSSAQLKDILLGKTLNWKELGGPDLPIELVIRKGRTSGVGYMARLLLFNRADVVFRKDAIRLHSSGPVEKRVELNPGAIAISGISSAKRRSFKILKLDGQAAVPATIAAGRYPLFRPLYIATKGAPAGPAKGFLDWLLSTEGQEIVAQCGTVTLAQGKALKALFKHWGDKTNIVNFTTLP